MSDTIRLGKGQRIERALYLALCPGFHAFTEVNHAHRTGRVRESSIVVDGTHATWLCSRVCELGAISLYQLRLVYAAICYGAGVHNSCGRVNAIRRDRT